MFNPIFLSFAVAMVAALWTGKHFSSFGASLAPIGIWALYWLGYQLPREWRLITREERERKAK